MPTYTYRCDACDSEFDQEQRIVDPPLKKCVKCGKSKVRRLITAGNFILKGGGWYSDGYGSSKGSAPPASGSEAAKTSSTGSAPADGKAADKAKPSEAPAPSKTPTTSPSSD
jgi:putative FmdB family regulatory protein